jgi:hypothetical protein
VAKKDCQAGFPTAASRTELTIAFLRETEASDEDGTGKHYNDKELKK